MNEALFTTSGVRTARPMQAITQENAYEKNSNRAYPISASNTELRMRQPTASPAIDIMAIDNTL